MNKNIALIIGIGIMSIGLFITSVTFQLIYIFAGAIWLCSRELQKN